MNAARVIAVFGASQPRPDDALYALALDLGRRLAEAGFAVLTGAYGGVMEAASRGAREAGGRTIGIACAIFRDRKPNAYLDDLVVAADLFARTRELIERADGFVVLAGKSGTLAELALLWALDRAGCLGGRPVVLLAGRWREVVLSLGALDVLESSQLRIALYAERPAQAVDLLRAALAAEEPGA